jgi:signal transduction histidine kinase
MFGREGTPARANGMKEDDEMLDVAWRSERGTGGVGEAAERSTVSTEALARLDRLAAASVLAAGLAHEIASPLGALLGALEGLERRVHDLRRRGQASAELDELAEEVALASESTGAITDVVRDFQTFLRAAPEPEGALVDVRAAVERALRIARPRLRAVAHVEVELRAAPRVHGRSSRVVQVALNLLLNAAEALASRARAENRITVRVDVVAGRALIEVSDNGPGLPAGAEEVVALEARGSTLPRRWSSGLGLPISRELVRRMGGEMTSSSLPGAGTTFLVSLPPAS